MTRYHRRSSFLYVYTCVRWKNKKYRIRYFPFFFLFRLFISFSLFFFSFFFSSMSSKMSNRSSIRRSIFFFFFINFAIRSTYIKKRKEHTILLKRNKYMIVGSLRTTGSFYEYSHTHTHTRKKIKKK